MKDSTTRFSDRVANYTKYRPGYPQELVAWLAHTYGLQGSSSVADIGSGTGIFTRLLLEQFNTVWAVEPNQAMREEAERLSGSRAGFKSVDGTSSHTGLADASVDLITVAQAFHWFNQEEARLEFRRILKPEGVIALVWNKRKGDSGFLQAYEDIVSSNIPEYQEVKHHNVTEDVISRFFASPVQKKVFSYRQDFNLEGVLGRLQSSSYCPLPETEAFGRIREQLASAFAEYSQDEKVSFAYDTELYSARFGT